MEEKHSRLDWIDLPATAEIIDLCLHDGELCAVSSNMLDRTMRLEFDGQHLLIDSDDYVDCPKIIFQLEGVKATLALSWSSWPGSPLTVPRGVSDEERERLSAERKAKGRVQSASWSEFEATLHDGDWGGPEVADAVPAAGSSESGIALKLNVFQDRIGRYYELIITAEKLELSMSDGKPLTLEQNLKLCETAFVQQMKDLTQPLLTSFPFASEAAS